MAYRNKCYVCFDGDNDIRYYRLMQAWNENDKFEFSFYDAHALTQARDTSSEDTIKRSLRERLNNSREFMVLIGENTKNLYRFVRWEMEIAIEMDLPIIAVNLNGLKRRDDNLCPPIIRDQLAVHIPFAHKIMDFAISNWREQHYIKRSEKAVGPHFYNDSIYTSLGL